MKSLFDAIYERFFSPAKQVSEIDSATSRFIQQIDEVMEMLNQAAGASNVHAADLAQMNRKLGTTTELAGVRVIIENLIRTARDMEMTNRTLEERLNKSKQEVHELPMACDVQQKVYDTCRGWNDFTNEQLAKFYFQLTGDEIAIR